MKFKDIATLTTEEKTQLLRERYPHKIHFAGKKHHIIDRVISLNKNSKPNPERLAAIEGIWSLTLAKKYDINAKYLIICPEQIKSIESQELIDYFIDKVEETIIVSERVFVQLSEKENAQGIMAVIQLRINELKDMSFKGDSLIVILDGLEIPGNIGTILRSCEATGVDGVVLNNRKVRINHPKLLRSSMGSLFKVPVFESQTHEDMINYLRDNGYTLILADTDSEKNYFELEYQGRIALIMGSEKYGIDDSFYQVKHEKVKIPMMGDMDSLNVGVATTILLYEAALKNKGILKR